MNSGEPPSTLAESLSAIKSVVIVQAVLPDYRQPVVEELQRVLGDRLQILSGRDYFDPSIRSRVAAATGLSYISNVYFAGRRLLWLKSSVRPAVGADLALMELNPRNLSGWAILIIRRILGRRTVLWGHAWPRLGRGSRTDWIRGVMRRLAQGLVVYTDSEKRSLEESGCTTPVYAAPNALFRAREIRPVPRDDSSMDVICVGRLVPEKKPRLLLKAFAAALDDLPCASRLIFVGDGPLRTELEESVAALGFGGRVIFAGRVTELSGLVPLYSNAALSVSPGYVGLSLIQSLALGVPMAIAREEPHAPEVEAAVEGFNSVMFQSDSESALSEAIVALVVDRQEWLLRAPEISRRVAAEYSVEAMVSNMVAALVG